MRTLVVYGRQSTHCRKRWEDLRHWAQKTAESQLGMTSQRGRGARRTLNPLMACILAVAYPEMDGCSRASQQPQRASTGGEEVAPAMEGAASHRTQEAESTDTEGASGTEGEESTMAETRGDSSDLLSWKVPGGCGHLCDNPSYRYSRHPRISTDLPAAPHQVVCARSPRRVGISFALPQ
ncbi:hypothetical protein NDU88_007722 [Pleurodeles waltl]|uniref:Uncharacterized protein n=1 Tax=Pleurodeles waltl TaxID=8319 RepID=A0AAV7QLQ4_PLEWA|nr:hypothetical protein NDU88_007722 [Pleurodeles waltl]